MELPDISSLIALRKLSIHGLDTSGSVIKVLSQITSNFIELVQIRIGSAESFDWKAVEDVLSQKQMLSYLRLEIFVHDPSKIKEEIRRIAPGLYAHRCVHVKYLRGKLSSSPLAAGLIVKDTMVG